MLSTTNILLIVFIPIIVIIISFFSIYIILKKSFIRYAKFYKDLNDFLYAEPYNETKTILKTVDISLNQMETNIVNEYRSQTDDLHLLQQTIENDIQINKIKNDKNDFADNFNEIETKIKRLRRLKSEGEKLLEYKKFFSIQKNILEIRKIQFSIHRISENVDKKAKQYINEIKEIKNVIWKYRNLNKQINKIIEEWKENVDDSFFHFVLNNKVKTMNELNSSLEKQLDKNDNKESRKYFNLYKKEMFQIITFANYFNNFYKIIFLDTISFVNKIKDYYNKAKNVINSNLSYLEIDKYWEHENNAYQELKKSFCNLQIDETIEQIKKYFNILIDINMIISSESIAYAFINEPSIDKFINDSYNKINEKFVKILSVIEKAISIDKNYFDWLNEEKNELNNLLINISELKLEIDNEKYNNEISCVSKQFKIKKYTLLIKSFNNKCRDIENQIEAFYAQGINPRLRFSRIKSLLLSSNAAIKRNHIIIDENEKSLIKFIENKRNKIDKMIIKDENLNKELLEELIDDIQVNCIEYIKTINKKILIVKIYNYINEKYSYLRSQNYNFHEEILKTEKDFIDGKYEQSLISLINCVERGIN